MESMYRDLLVYLYDYESDGREGNVGVIMINAGIYKCCIIAS